VRELRELTRCRHKLVKARTSCKDQVHAVLAKRVEPPSSVSFPSARVNPLMLGVPLLSTYTSVPQMATLVGLLPPELARSASRSPAGSTANTDSSSLPAFTTSSRRPSSLSATEPAEARCGKPVPRPPVEYRPSGASALSSARLNAMTSFPVASLV
jgi:hypothetical protein